MGILLSRLVGLGWWVLSWADVAPAGRAGGHNRQGSRLALGEGKQGVCVADYACMGRAVGSGHRRDNANDREKYTVR